MDGPEITPEQRERVATENWAVLKKELLRKHLRFTSRPYEAHVQFSNFCNMSCVMCWDGGNPPLRKMYPEVLERVAKQIAPSLSVITPYEGSEPLIVSWDETRDMARKYSIQLALTTNTQFLDEEKFHELKDLVEFVSLSIDSHIPEVFEKIRPGSKPEAVFENLKRTVRLCEAHGIECMIQAVLMTENAPMMPETITYMAGIGAQTVNVIQLIDVNKHSGYLDPTLHFSVEWMRWLKEKCIAAAREGEIRLGWWLGRDTEWFDFRDRERAIRPRISKVRNDTLDHLMKLRHPGFCRYAYNRLRIMAEGDVSPCGMATEGELSLGDLSEQDFDDIWNGVNARDLRRAHYTWDFPSLCKSCRLTDPLPPQERLPFVPYFLEQTPGTPDELELTLALEHPVHMSRLTSAPIFRIRQNTNQPAGYVVLVALGGELEELAVYDAEPHKRDDGTIELHIADDVWSGLETNLGYWWTVVQLDQDGIPRSRAPEAWCLIRHEHMPRIEGSTLGYPDEGHVPAIYLGGQRQIGWEDSGALPARPLVTEPTGERANGKTANRALRDHLAAYDDLVRRLRDAAG